MTTNQFIEERKANTIGLSREAAFDAGVKACAEACLGAGGYTKGKTSPSFLFHETQRIIQTLLLLS